MIDREDQVLLECPYGGRLGKFAGRFVEVGGDVAKRRVRVFPVQYAPIIRVRSDPRSGLPALG